MPKKVKPRKHAVHEQRKTPVCPRCTATFSTAGSLTRHVLTVHEKSKDHKCGHCTAAFGEAGHLTTHVRTVHEKRRDYVCPHCPAAFGQATNLTTHVGTQHPNAANNTALGINPDQWPEEEEYEEQREDLDGGRAFTRAEFVTYYGGHSEWDAATTRLGRSHSPVKEVKRKHDPNQWSDEE